MGRPPTSNFGGTVPPVPLGLRPCQRRFQRGSSERKRNVLRERQDVAEIPDLSLARSRGGRLFQEEGPITAKARHCAKAALTRGTKRSKRSAERRGRADVEDIGLRI